MSFYQLSLKQSIKIISHPELTFYFVVLWAFLSVHVLWY